MRVWLTTANPEAVESLRKDLLIELNRAISQRTYKSKVSKRKLRKSIKEGDLDTLLNSAKRLKIKIRVATPDEAGFVS